jgi:putative spermidine/putrescine transport system ATP-binding protein
MLALVGLAGYGARLPAQMSGGQQQRVALARVLATDPRVLLFDEPLSALDRNLRDTLKYSILDLQRRTAKTAIYVTHDQSEAFAISDRIVVMNSGRVEQIGTQMEIYLSPRTEFVAEFIGANNGLVGTVTGTEGVGDAARTIVSSGDLVLRCRTALPATIGDRVVAYLRPEDVVVLQEGEPADFENVVEGTIERVIFEGPTAQLRVDVGGRQLRADVSGGRRLIFPEGRGRVRLGFDDLTLIRVESDGPGAVAGSMPPAGPVSAAT